MGGIIAGALGGLGEGMMATGRLMGEQALQDQHTQASMNLAQMQSDLALHREQALEQFKTTLGNQQRQAQVDRIGAAQQGIIANQRANNANKFYGGDSSLTDDDLTDEEKKEFGPSDAQQQDAYVKAAQQTGDIDPKTVANNASRQEIAAVRAEGYQRSIEAKLEAANSRTEMMGVIAQMRVDAAKATASGEGKLPSDAKMIEYLVKNNGMSHQEAADRVLGTGAGKTKDPVSMAASLASSLIANGAVSVPKNAPPGTTVASVAMQMAMDQIDKAEQKFNKPASPAPALSDPTSPAGRKDPLGLFPGKK